MRNATSLIVRASAKAGLSLAASALEVERHVQLGRPEFCILADGVTRLRPQRILRSLRARAGPPQALSARAVIDDDILDPRAHTGRDTEEDKGQHPEDPTTVITTDQKSARGRRDDLGEHGGRRRLSRRRKLADELTDSRQHAVGASVYFLDVPTPGFGNLTRGSQTASRWRWVRLVP